MVFGLFWDGFGVVWGWFRNGFGMVLGRFLGWFWDGFRVVLGLVWDGFRVVLGFTNRNQTPCFNLKGVLVPGPPRVRATRLETPESRLEKPKTQESHQETQMLMVNTLFPIRNPTQQTSTTACLAKLSRNAGVCWTDTAVSNTSNWLGRCSRNRPSDCAQVHRSTSPDNTLRQRAER